MRTVFFQDITDGYTPTYRRTTGDNIPVYSHKEQSTDALRHGKMADNATDAGGAGNVYTKSSESTSTLQLEFEELEEEEESKAVKHQATSTSDITALRAKPRAGSASAGKPIMISAKTSTPLLNPCDCPETIFYHQFQHIGTETRYAEFKKGGVISDQGAFKAIIARYTCGFLNSEGGTLYFGVSDEGIVLGITVDKALEETLRMDIDFAIRLIEPSVEKYEYSINFARVMMPTEEISPDLKVLEVCVKPHQPPINRYSFNDVVYLRRDGSLQVLTRTTFKNKRNHI